MAFFDLAWYVNFGDGSTTGHFAVTKRPQNTAVAAGVIRRQFTAPTADNERCFVCIVAGTTANTTDATWTLTRGAKTTDGTATWQECTGAAAVNGDATNTPSWTSVASLAVTLGQIIKRVNGASYWICSTAGTPGASEPAWANDTAGTTRTDGTATWTCLGVVGNFTAWGAPFARLTGPLGSINVWMLAGNTIFVADNHNETAGAPVLSSGGTVASPTLVYSVDHTAAVPPGTGYLLAGATLTATNATATMGVTGAASYFYGFTFKCTGGSTTTINVSGAGPSNNIFDNCNFIMNSITGSVFNVGGTSSTNDGILIEFRNCTLKTGHAGQLITVNKCKWVWKGGGLDATSTSPTIFLSAAINSSEGPIWLEGLDLSVCSGTLVSRGSTATAGHEVELKDCKIHASATIAATPNGPGGINVDAIRCDSGGTNYKSSRYRYGGTETTETSITRVGGATDGTTAQSRKLVTTANAKWIMPFESTPMATWNESTSTTTVTVYGTWNSGSVPNNDDIWIEVTFPSSASTTLGAFANGTKANNLASGSALSSDGSSWNGGGSGAGWSPFVLTATVAPLQKGPLSVQLKAARASATFYVDPQVSLS